MHLARQDALAPYSGGSRPKSRGYVTVREPAKGFFIAGSSLDDLNGIYAAVRLEGLGLSRKAQIAYRNDTGWIMALMKAPPEPKKRNTAGAWIDPGFPQVSCPTPLTPRMDILRSLNGPLLTPWAVNVLHTRATPSFQGPACAGGTCTGSTRVESLVRAQSRICRNCTGMSAWRNRVAAGLLVYHVLLFECRCLCSQSANP